MDRRSDPSGDFVEIGGSQQDWEERAVEVGEALRTRESRVVVATLREHPFGMQLEAETRNIED